jgi:multimeric flavodoxin WrbA
MNIIVLNGSPRPTGNTKAMIEAYKAGAESAGHSVHVFDICKMNVHGCLACEYCHTKEDRVCVQKDDMQEIYPVLDAADMIVLASPVYYHGFSGQLQCAINRIYALDHPKNLKKAALLLSSGDTGVYDGVIYAYQNSFLAYLHLEDMGIFTAAGDENKSESLLTTLKSAGAAL